MAVHTPVSKTELDDFIKLYDLGSPTAFEGIKDGIENSNFHVFTTQGRFVLTLFERRTPEQDLPFFMNFMKHLRTQGIPCPMPVNRKDGAVLGRLCNKPAVMLEFMPGQSVKTPEPDHCRAIGALLADMHRAAADFAPTRSNPMNRAVWRKLIGASREKASSLGDVLPVLDREIEFLNDCWPQNLPQGAIHADLFPDNVFFNAEGRISGVLDFYFACSDFFIYDLMLTFNAWCFDAAGRLIPDNADSFMRGYESGRTLTEAERKSLPLMGRSAALRIVSTRLYDWFHTAESALVGKKDPLPYMRILEYHREKS